MAQSVLEILAAAGIKGDEALAMLRTAKREEAEQRAALLAEKKDSNYSDLCEFIASVRATLESDFANFLPGTHANFTVRVDKDGNVLATANDCHSTGKVEAIHITDSGAMVFGAEGAELAKNVRPRRK